LLLDLDKKKQGRRNSKMSYSQYSGGDDFGGGGGYTEDQQRQVPYSSRPMVDPEAEGEVDPNLLVSQHLRVAITNFCFFF